jgi:hypothetical protein
MANERPTSSRLIVKRLRLPYEAPRLQITALRPEEQLLVCLKDFPVPPCITNLGLS